MLERILKNGLIGKMVHVRTPDTLEGLDWQLAGQLPAGSPYTIWQLLGHILFWQQSMLAEVRGEAPSVAEHASDSWPKEAGPVSEEEWLQALARLRAGIADAMALVDGDLTPDVEPGRTRGDTLAILMGHNTYHIGQIVLLRRMLGAWPPPGGGATW